MTPIINLARARKQKARTERRARVTGPNTTLNFTLFTAKSLPA